MGKLSVKMLSEMIDQWIKDTSNATKSINGISELDDNTRSWLIRTTRRAIADGTNDKAVALLGVAAVLTGGTIMYDRRLMELLRPSIYPEARLLTLKSVLEGLQSQITIYAPTLAGFANKISSISAYVNLYIATRKDEGKLIDSIRQSRIPVPHAMLVHCELLFGDEHPHITQPDAQRVELMNKEDIASAVSYAIEAWDKSGGSWSHALRPFKNVDPSIGDIKQQMLLARNLHSVLDFEACIFRQNYVCAEPTPGHFTIDGPSQEFEMSLTFGHIMEAQAAARETPEDILQWPSFIQLCEEFVDKFGTMAFRMAGEPGTRRLVFAMPDIVAKYLSDQLFKKDRFYREEISDVAADSRRLLLSLEETLAVVVRPHLTILDILQIQRMFRFLAVTRSLSLKQLGGVPSFLRAR